MNPFYFSICVGMVVELDFKVNPISDEHKKQQHF